MGIMRQGKSRRIRTSTTVMIFGAVLLIVTASITVFRGVWFSKAAPEKEAEFVKEGSYKVQIKQNSQWDEGEVTGSIYRVKLKNLSDTSLTEWKVGISFLKDMTISQLWSAAYESNENGIVVKGLEYNKTIKAGEEISFGFVVNSSENTSVKDMDITCKVKKEQED